jgi:eukaryotic-like serine/threonine-protein kinase
MGEVYRARDTKLNRDVAIKVLPEALAHDPERLARFEREARTLAALNHPNIGAIYGLEEVDGVRALVLELVDGPTLADRIAQGPMPIDEALPIARQIAEALEAAHEHGTIHRDLKPANVKLRPDGTVKVLDFGLAKALDSAPSAIDASQSPTITSPAMTGMGVILGTAPYMSPEQAKGRQADKRSDVWAFGAVLYEMLSGQRAFKGEDVSDTLAMVLKGEPEWNALPGEASPLVVTLIRRCLEKDRRRRIAEFSTVLFIIDESARVAAAPPVQPASLIRRTGLPLVAAGTAAVIAGYTTWMLKPASAPSLPLARFTITLPTDQQFSSAGRHLVALSPDGTHIVYVANARLYLRAMEQLEAVPIRGTEGTGNMAGRSPFFSPDGQWIGFWQDGQLKKVSITGGSPVVLCAAQTPWGASWATDNTILYGQADGIWRVSGNAGKPENVVKVDAGQIAHGPQLLPGGRDILFTLARGKFPAVPNNDWDAAQIVVQSLDTGIRRVVLEGGRDARYLSTGHLVYAVGSTLLGVPFDAATLAVTGGPVPLVEAVARAAGGPALPSAGLTGAAHFAMSSDGALIYVPTDAVGESPESRRTLVWVDRKGREVPLRTPPRAYVYPRLSPDGTRVALDIRDQESDIWILDLARETLTRLTFGPALEFYGIWTPDGQAVIFSSGEFGGNLGPRSLFRRAADGTGPVEELTQGAGLPLAVTPKGMDLIFGEAQARARGTGVARDLMLLPLAGDRRPQPLVQTPYDELNAEPSPDGRWLAYESNESGQYEIYVRPFPNVTAGRWQVSTSGGTRPLWARNGQELFYESMGALMRVPLTTGSTFTAGTPTKLFDAPYFFGPEVVGRGRTYEVSPDGQRFLMIKEGSTADESTPSARLVLVQHWFEELKRRVPTN